jgi:hypothetical protein
VELDRALGDPAPGCLLELSAAPHRVLTLLGRHGCPIILTGGERMSYISIDNDVR